MILSLCLTVLVITTITCEPPLNNYLPPSVGGGSGNRPVPQYGPPETNQGGLDGFNSGRGQPRDNFDLSRRGSSGSPSVEYGLPRQGSQGFQGGSRSQQREDFPPSSQYRNPSQEGNGRIGGGSNNGRGLSQRPESSYGTPSQGFSAGQNGFKSQNTSPRGQGSRGQFSGSPSSSYGTPDFGNDRDNTNQNYRRSGVDESNEPAKYEFSYEVDDVETGTMFGHSEQRDDEFTTGQYNVVLPDGRKQVVEYEANKDGYKPQIRYEDTGRGRGAGSGLGQGVSGVNGRQGYPGNNAHRGIESQGGQNEQPGFGQGTSNGYPSGRFSDDGQDSFGNQGLPSARVGSGYPSRSGQSGFPSRTQDSGSSSGLAGPGYSSGPQGGRDSRRGGSRGSNNSGSDEGYPSGGPTGRRGSGY